MLLFNSLCAPSYQIMNLCSFEGEYSIEMYVRSHWAFSYVHWMRSCLTGLQLINYYVNNKYTLRYTGGMVPDVNQVLVLSNLPINCLSWMRFWKVGIGLGSEGMSMYQLGHAKLRSPNYFVQGRRCYNRHFKRRIYIYTTIIFLEVQMFLVSNWKGCT